ncbi:DUF4238 domain-containing protein [Bradyrhizobium sp. ORS 86]|uniref:DUF4238 domain-containing protein n=1 Tax=Bradyrhizobium sp. ORS 86 TaxID=1685970 RepID=UPI00388FF900
MSKARNNHYVPQWYQEGFFEPGRNTLAYLDLTPPQRVLRDGRTIAERSLFDAPTSRAFRQLDLYSTFFGTSINDEIERKLFGDIDGRGSTAIRAFTGDDISEWHRHFQTLFEFIDIQKIRTPKGLDWLQTQYPELTQNELMFEMQGIRTMHCTIWTQGVREIVSAGNAEVKFIVSDHPVTVYNYARSPDTSVCAYPQDPGIALKASQTIFPLNRDLCLIFTNLEYAQDPSTSPLEKRTFARNYRPSMVRTDSFIRTRKLNSQEVMRINRILKARARRYIAAGQKEWLYPENSIVEPWEALKDTLLPPRDGLWQFGGEMFARFEDGSVYYQDQFGRTEKERDFLMKPAPATPPAPKDQCGCGSGFRYKDCCLSKPLALRSTWTELSIRERNLTLFNGIVDLLNLDNEETDWLEIRRTLTDDKIREIYFLFQALWPLETDLFQMLPKPDGTPRAVFTGLIHPTTIKDFAVGASLYFGSIIIQHPFQHAGTVRDDYSPVKNPSAYRQEFLKDVLTFSALIPLIELGLVNLVPDPCYFDAHLRDQMLNMARLRSATFGIDMRKETRARKLMEEDSKRSILSFPEDILRHQILKMSPNLGEDALAGVLQHIAHIRENDPLAVLQNEPPEVGRKIGLLNSMRLTPNFEMAIYLAQATGSCIVTDSPYRWAELGQATARKRVQSGVQLSDLVSRIQSSTFAFPQNVVDVATLSSNKTLAHYQSLMTDVFSYLSRSAKCERKPNREANLAARFTRFHAPVQDEINRAGVPTHLVKISCVFPSGGIQHNNVNRLLLMSSSEKHLPNVPMAFLLQQARAD